MPRERSEIFRESNQKPKAKIIVLAYEGNVTEASYFEELKTSARYNEDLIYLHALKRKKNDTKSAPYYVLKRLKREAKINYNFGEDDEFWMIIDRDKWSNIPDICIGCKAENNFYLALSNPCFELWLLLHIRDLQNYSQGELDLIYANEKVRNKTYLKRHLNQILPDGYDDSNPKISRFLSNIDQAIVRAQLLNDENEDYPTKLGSNVYKLVRKIII